MAGRVYVDTNIFIRLFEGNDALSAALVRLFVLERRLPSHRLATSELTLLELLVAPYRAGDDRLIDQYDNWTVSNPYLEVGPVDRAVLWFAAVLRSQYPHLRTPDAIHLATAVGMECTYFLTADQRLKDRYELNHSRYGLHRGPAVVEIVRPEPDVIDRLVEIGRAS